MYLQVFVLISTDAILRTIPDYILDYNNIMVAKVDFSRLVINSSASKLWASGAVTSTGFYQNNISNVLRIVLLLKFGGIYLDSDVISVKSLPRDEPQGRSV